MKLNHYISLVILLIVTLSQAQHQITIDATLLPKIRTITIEQELVYKNNSDSTLKEIYLNDWANSFSSKNTPLAKRFSENYQSSFHFEKNKNRGHSKIISINNETKNPLIWTRGDEVDIIRVQLDTNLLPGETCILKMEYHIILPDDKFTKYGITKSGDFKIRYWYIAPAVFDGEWNVYSNKDLNDSYLNPTNFNIKFHTPYNFNLISDLDLVSENTENKIKTTELKGENRMQVKLQILKISDFKTIKTDKLLVSTNHTHLKITPPIQALIIDRIVHYLDKNLGSYPFNNMVLSEIDYKRNPVYGLNLLPEFISPFPNDFEYDIEMFKIISRTYLENTLVINPREDHWIIGAFQVYLMMEYIKT